MTRRNRLVGALSFVLAPLALTACTHNVAPLFSGEPYTTASQSSMVFKADELTEIGAKSSAETFATTAQARNEMIVERMYLIDQAYLDYETRLTHDDQFIGALGPLATLATTTVAAAIPVGEATKTLSAVASGITGGVNIYDQKVLLSQTMQALQNQMRTDRDNQAATMFARMSCAYDTYPMGIAYSDLEAYARAGTLSSALLGLNKTTSQAQTQAATAKNTASKTNPTTTKGANTGLSLASQLTSIASTISKAATCPLTPPPK
jgi:hypothetical protein